MWQMRQIHFYVKNAMAEQLHNSIDPDNGLPFLSIIVAQVFHMCIVIHDRQLYRIKLLYTWHQFYSVL